MPGLMHSDFLAVVGDPLVVRDYCRAGAPSFPCGCCVPLSLTQVIVWVREGLSAGL
jgi:hypothetical protein